MTDKAENNGGTPGDSVLEDGALTLSKANFRIKVAGPDLEFRNLNIDDAKPTGHQIVAAAGFHPVENYGLLQWLPTGDLEPLRLNETVDLRPNGAERFIIAQTDRAFYFELEGERQEWLLAFINGITLKRLAGKDPESVIVVLEREEDAPDEEIEDEQTVDLSGAGLEKFRVRPLERLVEIFVNDKPVKIERGEHNGLEIKQAAIAQNVQIQLDFVLSLEKRHGETQIIGDSDPVKVKKGQHYVAIAGDDNS
ncbi:multiubiquitin domain-containing protein [Bradyrhizobium sp. 5.13L]